VLQLQVVPPVPLDRADGCREAGDPGELSWPGFVFTSPARSTPPPWKNEREPTERLSLRDSVRNANKLYSSKLTFIPGGGEPRCALRAGFNQSVKMDLSS